MARQRGVCSYAEIPLGRALMGKEEGEEVEMKIGDKTTCYEVVTIC